VPCFTDWSQANKNLSLPSFAQESIESYWTFDCSLIVINQALTIVSIQAIPYAGQNNPYLTQSLPAFGSPPPNSGQQGANVKSLNGTSNNLIPPLSTFQVGKQAIPCLVMAMPTIPWTPNSPVNVAANLFIDSGNSMYTSTYNGIPGAETLAQASLASPSYEA
jgi:hypothetical protein